MTKAVATDSNENSYVLLNSIAENKFPLFTRVKYSGKENLLINTLLTSKVDFGSPYGKITYEDARKQLQKEIDKSEEESSEQTKGMVSVEAVKNAVNNAVNNKSNQVRTAMSANLTNLNDDTTQAVVGSALEEAVGSALEEAVRSAVEAAMAEAGREGRNEGEKELMKINMELNNEIKEKDRVLSRLESDLTNSTEAAHLKLNPAARRAVREWAEKAHAAHSKKKKECCFFW